MAILFIRTLSKPNIVRINTRKTTLLARLIMPRPSAPRVRPRKILTNKPAAIPIILTIREADDFRKTSNVLPSKNDNRVERYLVQDVNILVYT